MSEPLLAATPATAARPPRRRRWRTPVVVALAALALLMPALWNGSVFFYWDSVDYVYLPFSFKLPMYRTMPYGLFAGIGRLAGGLWAVAAVQALIAAWLLREALVAFAPAGKANRWLLPLAVILMALTALGWKVGQLMPDALTGVMVLGILVLALDPGRLSRGRRLVVALIVLVGTAVHTSHLGLGVGLVASLAVGSWLMRRRWPHAKPRLRGATLAVLASLPLVLGIHWATVGKPFLSQPTSLLWLARMVQDGLAKRTLDELCPTMDLKLCPYRDEFPPLANDFLWADDSIVKRIGTWDDLDAEARLIIKESMRRFPAGHAWAAAKLTAEQLVMFATGDGVAPGVNWMIRDALRRYYPESFERFRESHQTEGIDFQALNRIHVPVLALFQLLLPIIAVMAWRRRDAVAFGLSVGVMLALLGNAFICGALSNPNDRYQGRIVWLAVVAVGLGAARWLAERDRGRGEREGAGGG